MHDLHAKKFVHNNCIGIKLNLLQLPNHFCKYNAFDYLKVKLANVRCSFCKCYIIKLVHVH